MWTIWIMPHCIAVKSHVKTSKTPSTQLFVKSFYYIQQRKHKNSALLALWNGNRMVTCGIHSQRSTYAERVSMFMMTSSNGNIFRVTGPLCGEFTGPGEFPAQRPVTRSFDVFFDLRPNKRLSKQPWGWWFETPSWSLWRQCNMWCLHVSQFFPTGGFPVGYQGCFSALSVGDPFLSDTQPVQVNNLAHCTRRCVNRGNYYAGLRKNSVSGDKF